MRARIIKLVEAQVFQSAIIGLIIINAITLGLETSRTVMDGVGYYLHKVDSVILSIFVLEIILRIYAYRLKFFKSPWSLFDLIVVSFALVPTSEAFAALRALRVLRVLRLISTVSSMRRVVEGLLKAIPGIMSVTTILLLFFYVFAVIGTHLFRDTFPEWFGTLGATMFSLFQIMTLESWSMGIVRPVMAVHPNSWIFFISYILISTFTMLNLFIAIIVNSMQSTTDQEAEDSRTEIKNQLSQEIKAIETSILKAINQRKD